MAFNSAWSLHNSKCLEDPQNQRGKSAMVEVGVGLCNTKTQLHYVVGNIREAGSEDKIDQMENYK